MTQLMEKKTRWSRNMKMWSPFLLIKKCKLNIEMRYHSYTSEFTSPKENDAVMGFLSFNANIVQCGFVKHKIQDGETHKFTDQKEVRRPWSLILLLVHRDAWSQVTLWDTWDGLSFWGGT